MTEIKRVARRPRPTPPPEPKPAKAVATELDRWAVTVDLGLYQHRQRAVIGIDCSATAPAIFALCPDDMSAYGYMLKLPLPSKGGPQGVKRLLLIERWLSIVLGNIKNQTEGVEHIVMEQYAFSRQMGHTLGEAGGTMKLALAHTFGTTNIVSFPTLPMPNQLKVFVLNNGQAEKNLMLKGVLRKWGVDLDSDNLADAYACARWAAAIVTGQTAHTYEADIVAKVGRHTEWEHQEPPPKTLSRSSARAKRASSG